MLTSLAVVVNWRWLLLSQQLPRSIEVGGGSSTLLYSGWRKLKVSHWWVEETKSILLVGGGN